MIGPLLSSWKDEVRLYRRRGHDGHARFLQSLIEEAEAFIDDHDSATFNLSEGAEASGYSASHLGWLIREGRIPNAGRPNAPRIASKDLPLKPGQVASASAEAHLDPTQIVRLAINQE